MTRREFYNHISRIRNEELSTVYSQLLSLEKDYPDIKCHSRVKGGSYSCYRKDLKHQIKKINSLEITLDNTNIMYDMLKSMNLEFDFHKKYIVIHYPEIQMEVNNHVIKDLYFMFVPIINIDIDVFYLNTRAFRSEYSYIEYYTKYLHPHISFPSNPIYVADSICFGNTPFYYNENFIDNFIRFLLYLDVYLRHENGINPYRHTISLSKTIGEGVSNKFNFLSKIRKINWSKYKFEFIQIDNKEYVCPKVDEDEIELYNEEFPGIKMNILDNKNIISNSTLNDIKRINEEESYITDSNRDVILFNNQPIRLKIQIDEPIIGYNPEWRKELRRQAAAFLTERYLEAYSTDFQTCDETEQVFMLQDTE